MSTNISIILVEPQGDANIGAVARAMKNFALDELVLVSGTNHLTKTAFMWAVDAADILRKAKKVTTLNEALKSTSHAVAFTRRIGKLRKKHLDVKDGAALIRKKATSGKVALVFGREDSGLSNDELRQCDTTINIPTSEKLPSINIAQSVIIAAYEIFSHYEDSKTKICATENFISRDEIKGVLERLGLALEVLDYDDSSKQLLKSKILHQFERIFGRAGLTQRDRQMLEGLIARIIASSLRRIRA